MEPSEKNPENKVIEIHGQKFQRKTFTGNEVRLFIEYKFIE